LGAEDGRVLKEHRVHPDRMARAGRPLIVRVPLLSAADAPGSEPLAPCSRCGSKGFSIHQRTWKRVKDPHLERALVVRFLCKRCGRVRRAYPDGIGASRQSGSLRHLTVLLYWIGLSYQSVRAVLLDLGCPLSTTSIRRNVEAARQTAQLEPPLGRLRLEPAGGGVLRGADGLMALRVVPQAGADRALEVESAPGPGASNLHWRLTAAATWLAQVFGPEVVPPVSA
jgi:hypothetical protein